ncbi:hypothetical protein BGZ96_008375 [Linnemannia gamsii]|uniref:WD40 repeat-like protein n=1 Tax=Linnemannia gamsii TaxID=64522 RepID=A0ABQ7JYD8_9FUNG|nr:hypothetical protein BGZ96_008375 [Linnemannia gamsii]
MGIDYSTKLATAIFEKQGGNPIIRYIHFKDKNTWRVEFFGSDPEYFYSRTVFDPSSHDKHHEFPPQSNSGSSGSSDPQIFDAESVLFKRNLLTELSEVQFLSERVKQHLYFKKRLLSVIEQSKSDATATTAAANAITILVRAGIRFNSADLRGIQIPGADLSDDQFDSAQFQKADVRGVKFSRSWLRQADFKNNMNILRLWDITGGKTLHIMQGHTNGVSSVAFSPCGKKIVSSSWDKTVRLWSSETGKEMFVLRGHASEVNVVKYAPDGRRLVSGSSDKTIRFWDSETGNPGLACDASSKVNSLDYSPDGRRVVSGHFGDCLKR